MTVSGKSAPFEARMAGIDRLIDAVVTEAKVFVKPISSTSNADEDDDTLIWFFSLQHTGLIDFCFPSSRSTKLATRYLLLPRSER